jgi:hypothetical protein
LTASLTTRIGVILILVVLLAAQGHICLDATQGKTAGHVCLLCHYGAWAIISAVPAIEFSFHIVGLNADSARLSAKDARATASSPRAPPQA